MKTKTYKLNLKRFIPFLLVMMLITAATTTAVNNVVKVKGMEDTAIDQKYSVSARPILFDAVSYPSFDNTSLMGQYSVFFHCDCPTCTGRAEGDLNKVGSQNVEGVTVAVDPEVIPYGTKIYVEGLGTFIAQDSIYTTKGNAISIYVEDHMMARTLGIRVLDVFEVKEE